MYTMPSISTLLNFVKPSNVIPMDLRLDRPSCGASSDHLGHFKGNSTNTGLVGNIAASSSRLSCKSTKTNALFDVTSSSNEAFDYRQGLDFETGVTAWLIEFA